VGAIREAREPRSGIDLAVECVNVIYAAVPVRGNGESGGAGMRGADLSRCFCGVVGAIFNRDRSRLQTVPQGQVRQRRIF